MATVNWHDPEMRHGYEVHLAITIILTLAMLIGGIVLF